MSKALIIPIFVFLWQLSLYNCGVPPGRRWTNPYGPREYRWGYGLNSFFTRELIVPYCAHNVTNTTCDIIYEPDIKIDTGMDYSQDEIKGEPTVRWKADPDSYYVLYMLGYTEYYVYKETFYPYYVKNAPDHEWVQWVVYNIPGNKVSKGEVLYPYLELKLPAPYVKYVYAILIYKQPGKMNFTLPKITKLGEHDFCSHLEFLEKHNLYRATAANLFVYRFISDVSEYRFGPPSSTLDSDIWAEETTFPPPIHVPFDVRCLNESNY